MSPTESSGVFVCIPLWAWNDLIAQNEWRDLPYHPDPADIVTIRLTNQPDG